MSNGPKHGYTELSKLDAETLEELRATMRARGISLEEGAEYTSEQHKIINDTMEEFKAIPDGYDVMDKMVDPIELPELSELPEPEPISYDEAFRTELSEEEIQDLKDLPEFYLRAMYLKEIQKEGNEELYDKLANKHIDSALDDNSDDFDGDNLLKAVHKYKHIEDDPDFEEIRSKVHARIDSISDRAIKDNLRAAGFSSEDIKLLSEEHLDSLRLQKAFFSEIVYEDGNKKQIGQAFNDALSKNKDAILGFLANKHTQYALNGLGLALAISSGGTVPLLMQGVKFAGMAMKNETVRGIFKNFAERIEAKCAERGIDITPVKEAVQKVNDYVEKKKSGMSTLSKIGMAVGVSVAAVGLAVALDGDIGSRLNAVLDESIDDTLANIVEEPAITISEFSVANDETATSIAREAYTKAMGAAPTEQQLVAIINDMGFPDPNNINPGDKYKLPSSFEEYGVDKIGKVQADWLGQTAEVAQAAQATTALEAMAASPGVIDLASQYNIIHLANEMANGMDFSEIERANPDVDLFNLSPGDEIAIGGIEYTVPEVDETILAATFGEAGVPEFIDADAYLDMVKEANPHIDFSEGFLGFGGNDNLGADLALRGQIEIPVVDVASLEPVSGEVVVSGVLRNNDLNTLILSAAFPNGVPDLIDGAAYCEVVREMNDGLNHVSHGDYFSKAMVLPNLEQVADHFTAKPEAPTAVVEQTVQQSATQRSTNFSESDLIERARSASKGVDKGLTL